MTAEEALANHRSNRLASWPDGRRSSARLEGVASVGFSPSFQIEPGEAIFTVGSCFARNIEGRLHALGFDVPALEVSLPADERISNTANDVLNKYTAHSILNEIRWGLKPGEAFPEEAYLQIDEERWHDPHLAGNLKPAPLARIRERRAIVSKLYGELKRCRIVVITLGVIETWYDTLTDLYLNEAPPVSSVRRYPGRFRMNVLSTTDTMARLEEIYDLLAAHGHPDFRMLITVSPVPLKSTFTTKDVIQANTYSKSTLRAAVESFVNAHERVDYFPSYEIVTHTLRDAAYIEDNRHVAVEVVSTVVDRMVGAYCHSTRADDDEVMTPSQARTIRSEIRNLHRKEENDKDRQIARQSCENRTGTLLAGYSEYEFRFEYGRALARVGSYVAADLQLSRAASCSAVVGRSGFSSRDHPLQAASHRGCSSLG